MSQEQQIKLLQNCNFKLIMVKNNNHRASFTLVLESITILN
eukprot:UN02482